MDHRRELEGPHRADCVTPEQARYVADLMHQLQQAYSRQRPLTPSALLHARDTLRSADAGRMELSEAEEERMDALYGLLQWGQIALPLLRVDPRLFAEQRRARRTAKTAPEEEWSD